VDEKPMNMKKGVLYLIPSLLAETNESAHFPGYNREVIGTVAHFAVENLRTTRRFFRKIGYAGDFEELVFFELNKHTDPAVLSTYLHPLLEGHSMGVLSEAGIPCVADPGSRLVRLAHEHGIQVVPLSGPSSIFLALMASGLNGQAFTFHGYLPIDRKERVLKIKEMLRAGKDKTQIFMETPYRNNQLMEVLLDECNEQTVLCIGSMVSHASLEFIQTKTIGEWKKNRPDLHKKPTVFLMQ
jgi:16S rRNA (cytidine1402-2'-O)-methyltransferase